MSKVCEDCNGSGEVEWIYYDLEEDEHYCMADCPVCEGTGSSEEDEEDED
jgi:hypothetical protein